MVNEGKEGMAQASEIIFPKLEEKTSLLTTAALFVMIGSVLIIALAVLTSLIASTRRSELISLNRKEQELETQLKSPEIAKLRSQLEGFAKTAPELKAVLEARNDWRGLLEQISRAQHKSVTLVTLSYDGKTNLRLDGAAADFSSVAKQVAALRGLPQVSSVEVASLSKGTNQITFSLLIELKLDQLSLKGATK